MSQNTKEEMEQKVSLWFQKYYQQLQNGCDNFSCKNEFCRSCADFRYVNITDTNELVSKIIMLVSNYGDRYLCKIEPIECSKFRIGKIRKYIDWGGDGVYQLEELVEEDLGTDRLDYAFQPPINLESKEKQNKTILFRKLNRIDPGLDFVDVFEALQLISTAQGNDLQNAIEPSIVNQLSILEKTAKTTTSFQYLRRFAILICFHAFSKKEFSTTLYRLIKLYHLLNPEAKEILNTWFERSIPSSILTKVVTFLNIFITNEMPQSREIYLPPSQTIIDASTLLGDIFVANRKKNDKVKVETFYNEKINQTFNYKENYNNFINKNTNKFSFCNFSFILSAQTKSKLLTLESQYKMRNSMRETMFNSLLINEPISPYFVLIVRRDHLVQDSVNSILRASKNDLKKKLKVVFEGEDGVDEGGVKKEFFQLVVQQIFDPKYGMFVENEEMNKTNFWFNKSYIGEMGSYRLIGTILGLAIYNSVILDVRFPSVVYKKLLNRPLVLEDLHDYRPEIERGMWQLLAYEGSVEEIYMRTFQISYKTVFGEEIFVNLKKNGDKIPLTNENREEYVKLFVEWELNKSIEKHFLAFRKGFESVCGSEVFSLIEPEELEALICGDHEFEMKDLKKSTKYRDGYNSGSIQMKWLWDIIFSWTKEKQKKFLAFCFGTDRVPIGGLSNLRFTITRGGPDSEILPKASTCYGILILPAYSEKEKLKRKIELAIENSQGFGLF
ncbi:hypothetical protein M0813_21663 [Anaeramoeba flamelloides]|uniref:HECT-type E3 ubiquitin transferase n=1 Tax=Anaeramoeba flamelloides TaxID=1746091 RepID=A0ABQ8YGY5_9EUKA|nr:hypothetical protein M0813_21663 [Anaeramoeba flamelloides]